MRAGTSRAHPSRMTKSILSVLALLLAACVSTPAPQSPIGAVHFYTRSNQDGSSPERVIVYRESETRIAVAKMVDPCTNAAYVTGEFDLDAGEPIRLVGGRLTRELTQAPFATIALDPATRTVSTRVELPDMLIEEELAEVAAPWRMYDFDLADITTLMQGRPAPRSDFSFTVVLAWPEGGGDRFVTDRGRADAVYAGAETRNGHEAIRYDVSGALNGQLWLSAAQGHVVEARFAEPNHPGYENFMLVLTQSASGAEAWRGALAAHWQGCAHE